MKAIMLALLCSFMITTGQVLWKIAIDKNGGLLKPGVPFLTNIFTLLLSPYMISGILVYAVATVFWMYLLGEYEYSFIYPMLAVVYLFALLYAIFLFKEDVNIYRWIGIILIMSGIVFITKSK